MAKKKQTPFDLQAAYSELINVLDNFVDLAESDELRQRVLALLPAFHLLRQFGNNIIPNGGQLAARDRILIYLQKYPLTIIDSEELLVVSGITDYQRRVRELRVEFGWPILSGTTVRNMFINGEWNDTGVDVSKIKPDKYIMLASEQDRDAAYRWRLSNEIRNEKLSVKDKLLKYLRANVGKEVTGEELAYIAKNSGDWPRRTRELRTEEGWPVKTKQYGRPDLSVGVYVLEEDKQAEPHDRHIPDSVRIEVLTRDQFRCRKCAWGTQDKKPEDPRQALELHHLDYHSEGGLNTTSNLVTLCNVHHDDVHMKRMDKDTLLSWIGVNAL